MRFMEVKCNAGNFKSPDETGLNSPRNRFAVFTYIANIRDSQKWKCVSIVMD